MEPERLGENRSTLMDMSEEQREPLLREDGIIPFSSSDSPYASNPSPANSSQRLASLDVFRGLTVALMILVDDAGGAFPSINHSPWFGVMLADFVMPFFLFGVGVSIGLAFKNISSKTTATKKVILRTVKLFLLGLFLQGGYFHGRNHLTFGVDVEKIRWLGVLQRISIGYMLASMSEIWLVNRITVESPAAFVRKYYIQWIFAVLLCSIYMCLLHGLYVPNWEYEASSMNYVAYASGSQIMNYYILQESFALVFLLDGNFIVQFAIRECDIKEICHRRAGSFDCVLLNLKVHCEVRGSLEPPCNAVGLIDRLLLGEHHLYQHPVYRRTKECSVNSPDYGPLPPNSPGWCLAPFDPEGILSSLMAAITCFVGLQFGHILIHFKCHMQRIFLWTMLSLPFLIAGYVLEFLGVPFCKPLYTLSYMCITAGTSGLFLTSIFYIVDVKLYRKPTMLLEWMGMNALIVYAVAACDLFPAALQGFYWRSPKNNLVDGTEMLLQAMLHSRKWGTLAFVILEIIFWGLVAGFLHMKGVYVKL